MREPSAARACREDDQRKDRRASDLEVSDKEREIMPSGRGLFTRPPRILRSLGGRLVVCREGSEPSGRGEGAGVASKCRDLPGVSTREDRGVTLVGLCAGGRCARGHRSIKRCCNHRSS
jgi:hypothetical protein